MFVSTLGTDTVAVERYTRSATKLEGDIAYRFPRPRITHYVADLAPDGTIRSLTAFTRNLNDSATAAPAMQLTSRLSNGSAAVSVQRNGRPDTTASGTRSITGPAIMIFPGAPASFAIYEQMLRTNQPGTDSIRIAQIGPGSGDNVFWLRRENANTVVFTNTWQPRWIEIAQLDAHGRILSVNSTAATVGTRSQRVASVDFDAILSRWAAEERQQGGRPIAMSPRDTVSAVAGGANIQITYGRPFKRGRTIFGNVVRWNEVWRTGANAATTFSTSRDLVFGSTVLPAGNYTLWTLPSPTGTKLIINRQTGQWGTAHDASQDFARLDLITTQLSAPVEQFTISVVPQGAGGELRFAWDKTQWSVPFTVR